MVLAETQITPDRLGLGLTLRWSPGGGPFASGRRSRSSKRSLLAGGRRSEGRSRGRPAEAASVLNSPATEGPRPRGDRAEQADRCASLRRAGSDDGRRGADPGTTAAGISALGATPIDYTKGSFVERIRERTGEGVDVVLDGIGGRVAVGSYRALRRGGRLVMYGHYGTTVGGPKSARKVALFYLSGALVFAGNLLPDGRRVRAFQVAKLRDRHPGWFREDATTLFELLAAGRIEPIVAGRIPLAEARRAHENLGRGGVTGKQVLVCDEEAAA